MHSPEVVVFDLHVPIPVLGWKWKLGTLWHYEPGDADMGTVCKSLNGSDLSWGTVKWAWRHRAHCEFHWATYRRVHRWLTQRCGECEQRFRWGEAPISGMDEVAVRHRTCDLVLSQRRQLDDLFAYLDGDRSGSRAFRVMRARDHWRQQQANSREVR